MRTDRLLAAPLVAVVALLSTSCSSQPDTPSAAPPASTTPAAAATPPAVAPSSTPSPAAARITIAGFAYDVPASVPPGASVTVENLDREAHTVTLDGGAVRLSVLPGATASFQAPASPGSYTVVCDLHGGMDAVLVVA